jgi:hypothetical protein
MIFHKSYTAVIKGLFTFLLLFITFSSFGQKYFDKVMKKTADNLLTYFKKEDTAAIVRLYADYYIEDEDEPKPSEEEYKKALARILQDCKTYQGFIKKYGAPKRKDYTISDGINGGKQLIVTISSKPDTILNRSYCKLVIQFYPITIIPNPEVIYGYWFDTGSVSEKLKMNPPLQNPAVPVIKNN